MKQVVPTKDIVYLDNKLAQASYSLNLNEQRLLFLAIGKLNQGYKRNNTKHENYLHEVGKLTTHELLAKQEVKGEDFDTSTLFSVNVFDYAKTFGLESTDARKELQTASETLLQRYVTTREADGSYKKFHWVQGIEYDAKADSVNFYWTNYLIPYIKDLQNYFTKLKLDQFVELQSTYSWKLLTALQSKKGENKYKNEITFDLEDLYFVLDVPESCKEFKHFNNLILKKVLKEIQSKTKMKLLSVRFEKEGRWVKRVVFSGACFAGRSENELG